VESTVTWGRWLTSLLAVAACLGIAGLLWFGYRATRAWQQSSDLLITVGTNNAADLLVSAVTRDMRGVQSRILANRDWAESSVSSADTRIQVAIAFTRYPYPESFFTWKHGDSEVVFFNRVNRYPAWMPEAHQSSRLPVILVRDPPGATALRQRINAYGAARFRYVVFDSEFAGRPYQIVARLMYTNPLQEEPDSVVGFTVNLAWVRESYFGDLLPEVASLVEQGSSLEISVLDEKNALVWGANSQKPEMIKEYPLLFLDPSLGKVALATNPMVPTWKLRVSQARNSPLVAASQGADEALLIAAAAALVLCLGLILVIHAVQSGIALATMRSDFVSSVTHDLKMPLANIRVMADTLALRPVGTEKVQHYARFLKQESRRLTRLIDNLLAYARVTDVAEAYRFEALDVPRLVDTVLQGFRQPLTEKTYSVEVDIPSDLPLVHADRASMMLALDNLIDNAIRYSTGNAEIRVIARRDGPSIVIEVRDRGMGIPADELTTVRKKFVRGRLAQSRGSGLGLAIVNRIVGHHGGTFELESTEGTGTVARMRLSVSQA
jgi:signal transduction histidine kinase